MSSRSLPDNAFGLRWLQDDDRGRLVYQPGSREFRSPADAISVLGLGCEEAALRESLDQFPPHLRIHGGYTPGMGEPDTHFTLTWEPGAAEARYSQMQNRPEDGMTGSVDVPPDGSLKEALRGLLVPDAQDVVDLAREEGKSISLKDVDFWIGEEHFKVSAGEEP